MTGSIDEKDQKLVRVNLSRENVFKEVNIHKDSNLIDLIKTLELPVDGVIILKNGIPIPLDHPIENVNDELTIINVASGG